MEEARANQERKTKILARMKESQKQNEVEKQRKEREKQAQAQVRKINRIKHTSNHTLKDGKKQSELQQVRYKKNPIETNTKIAKHKTHREEQQKHQQPNIQILKRKQEKHNSIPKPKIKTEGNNTLNKPIQIHKVEGRELNSKPSSLSTEKKAALNFNQLMELAKKNVGKNNVKPEEKAVVPSVPPLPTSHKPSKGGKQESESERSKGADKKRSIEESNKPTDSSKKLKLNKKKSQPPPQEPPKPRPQIQQSEFFRKTFDTPNSSKKPPYQTSRYGPSAPSSSRQDESSSDGDGFIVSDDDESSNYNVSAIIQKMFGYNKSKYVDEDGGGADEAMVSSFSQQQFEEKRSARIGMLEDLEDVKREEEELRRKMLIKKKKDKKLKRLQV